MRFAERSDEIMERRLLVATGRRFRAVMSRLAIISAAVGAVLSTNAVATSLQLPGAQCTPLEITLADRDDIRFLKSLQQRQCLYLEELQLSANKLKVF